MRKAVIFIFLLTSIFHFVGCDGSENREYLFPTENIQSITFYTPDTEAGIVVPQADLDDIIAWLATFTIGDAAGDTLIPGTNSIFVCIEYEDGTIVESGLSAVRIDERMYYLDCADAPACYLELING